MYVRNKTQDIFLLYKYVRIETYVMSYKYTLGLYSKNS